MLSPPNNNNRGSQHVVQADTTTGSLLRHCDRSYVPTFLLAPPSDTLGLVLNSPSKLNIVRLFPWTDTDFCQRKWENRD